MEYSSRREKRGIGQQDIYGSVTRENSKVKEIDKMRQKNLGAPTNNCFTGRRDETTRKTLGVIANTDVHPSETMLIKPPWLYKDSCR